MTERTRLNEGDLLRAWHALAEVEHGAAAEALQFGVRAETPKAPVDRGQVDNTPSDDEQCDDPSEEELIRDPVPLPGPSPTVQQVFWRVTEVRRQSEFVEREAASVAVNEPVDDAVFCSPVDAPAPPREAPLIGSGALRHRLHRHLVRCVDQPVPDLSEAVRWIAVGRPLHRMPTTRRQRLPGKVQVVMDASSALGPLRHDFIPVTDFLKRWLGPRQCVLRAEGSPYWISDAQSRPSQVRLDGSPVLVLGDAGLLGRSREVIERWRHLGQALVQAGHRPMLLLPASVHRVEPELAQVFDVVALDGEVRPALPTVRDDAADPVRWLLAAIFGNTYVRPGLLRRLRRVLQQQYPLDTAAEAQLWNHPAVVSNTNACALLPEQRAAAQADFAAWPVPLREAVIEVHLEELASMSPLVRAEYVLWVTPYVPQGARLRLVLDAMLGAADRLAEQVGARLQRGDDAMALDLAQYMLGFEERSQSLVSAGSDALQRAWVLAWRRSDRAGDVSALPPGLRLERLSGLLEAVLPVQSLQLVVEGGTVATSVMVRAETGQRVSALYRTEAMPLWQMGPVTGDVGAGPVYSHGDRVNWSDPAGFQVRMGRELVRVEPFSRPEWAESVWCEDSVWHARIADGRELTWVPEQNVGLMIHNQVDYQRPFRLKAAWWDSKTLAALVNPYSTVPWFVRPPRGAVGHGVDQYGWWADFEIKNVNMRMRFIQPGEFLMGSPETEVDRTADGDFAETQHPVLLTQGYWLADTVCTQALWEAVMGVNLGAFRGDPNLPVEKVSWKDITQKFLPRLSKLVLGLNMTLPTEAQWEYACRAGTTTPFFFGLQVARDQVNYNGNRGRTVPVKLLPANAWGLHEMHGNVWEWCADELVAYTKNIAIDPKEPSAHQEKKDGHRRVLRGGSWIRYGKDCRSACRLANRPAARANFIGFRLAMGFSDELTQIEDLSIRAANFQKEELNYRINILR